MSLQFKPFYNDWLDCTNIFNTEGPIDLHVNLSNDFFKTLRFDKDSLTQYRIDAAVRCAETLGDNPALCLSGGIDSQAMVQAWTEAGLKFKVFTLVFNDNLNIQDVSHARRYCNVNNIELIEIPFNIIQFLTRENYDIGIKYKSPSPHFNTHYKMFDMLRSEGYSGVCAGGIIPFKNGDVWGTGLEYNTMNFIQYADISGYPAQGSFLSFSPELAWAIALQTPNSVTYKPDFNTDKSLKFIEDGNLLRYLDKITGFSKTGFNVIPQEQKYTGFELVRDYFEELTGDGWTFERRFRFPFNTTVPVKYGISKLKFIDGQQEIIESIYNNNIRPNS